MNATRRRVDRPEPVPVVDQVHAMAENWLMCRDMRHAWATETPYYRIEVEGGVRGALYVERAIACMRCDSRRIEIYRVHEHTLERLASRYAYPKGYQVRGIKKGERVQDMVRYENYRRAIETVQ